MTKTVSVRMDENIYAFVNEVAKQENEEISKAIRNIMNKGRLLLAIQQYRDRKVSLGKAAQLAGVSVNEMIETLARFGIKANLEEDDYHQSLEHLRKIW